MKRPNPTFAVPVLIVASLLAVGCQAPQNTTAPSLASAQRRDSFPTGRVPLMVGDSVGVGVYTTRASLTARGFDTSRTRFASGEPARE